MVSETAEVVKREVARFFTSELLQASLLQWVHTEVITLPTKKKKEISLQAVPHCWGLGAFTLCGIVLVYSE